MYMHFERIESDIPKMAVWSDGVIIAELTFTTTAFEVLPTGHRIKPDELSMITVYAEHRLDPRKAARESARMGWKTRKGRQQLQALYALEDPRQPKPNPSRATDTPVDFLERLYSLTDKRSIGESAWERRQAQSRDYRTSTR